MKICMLLQSDFPPDVRLSKEASVLLKQGNEIHLLCNNRKNYPQEEILESIFVHRIKNINGIESKIHRIINAPLFFNPIWFVVLVKLVRMYRFDVLHVVNLPLALLAIIVGKLFQIPVIYDMYENYPEAIRSWKLKGMRALVRSPRLAATLDKICMNRADFLIVVIDEAKERLLKLGVNASKMFILNNTVDLEAFNSFGIVQEIVEKYSKNFTIIYTGQFSAERGIETAIFAMPRILKEILNAKLVLVGTGPGIEELKMIAQTNNLQDLVEFVGWVDYRLFPSYIQASDVCIIPHPSNPFIDTTIPNKLFEYMALGKPVLVSDAKPLVRIVSECQCGEIFKSNSPTDFADAVLRINRSQVDYGNNGRSAVERKHNWDFSSRELIKLYNEIKLNKEQL